MWGTRNFVIGPEFRRDFGDSVLIEAATISDVTELSQLYIAYRVFYEQAPDEQRAKEFIRERLERASFRYFLARDDARRTVGFMHLMPSTNTLAMRPLWFLEDLYVAPEARGQGVATALLHHAEAFARQTGAERLTLATAHDNLVAQHLYNKLGYEREEHFWYFHRVLP